VARNDLREAIAAGRYELVEADVTREDVNLPPVDIALAYMVIEHVKDDVGFVRRLATMTHRGGYVVVAAPGCRDRWCLEDETVGHLRRYDRSDLLEVMRRADLKDSKVWSVAVPICNLLFRLGNRLIEHSGEMGKSELGSREQTETSGLQEIPWKTHFPPWVRAVLNPVVLWPFLVLQRAFYDTDLGVTVLGRGRVGE
jgi:hypothetical protein